MSDPTAEQARVRDLIERSSLGDPESVVARESVTDEEADAVVALSKAIPQPGFCREAKDAALLATETPEHERGFILAALANHVRECRNCLFRSPLRTRPAGGDS